MFRFVFSTGGFILVSDYARMEVTLIGASWDVVAGGQTGCGLHSYEALWSTELPCARFFFEDLQEFRSKTVSRPSSGSVKSNL